MVSIVRSLCDAVGEPSRPRWTIQFISSLTDSDHWVKSYTALSCHKVGGLACAPCKLNMKHSENFALNSKAMKSLEILTRAHRVTRMRAAFQLGRINACNFFCRTALIEPTAFGKLKLELPEERTDWRTRRCKRAGVGRWNGRGELEIVVGSKGSAPSS
jgi:hypothetical protein